MYTPGMSPIPPDFESMPSQSLPSVRVAQSEVELRLMVEAQEREIKRLVSELSESKIKCEEVGSAMRQLITSNEGLERELKASLKENNSDDIIRELKYEIEALTLRLSAAERRELHSQQIASHSQSLLAASCSELERIYTIAPLHVLPTIQHVPTSIASHNPPLGSDQLDSLRAEVSQTQTDYNTALRALHETRQEIHNPHSIRSP
eukprot:TRINITY_DN20995_c0_g1_i4.p1 TRINITY_DN20995_c0_g1~~TRINITY_DN20995_c0_g1_i4.p1  ORF type:complete len:226 (+),score=25.54 TRINITY_DN20995_c0_g1_i4:63-680(+)